MSWGSAATPPLAPRTATASAKRCTGAVRDCAASTMRTMSATAAEGYEEPGQSDMARSVRACCRVGGCADPKNLGQP